MVTLSKLRKGSSVSVRTMGQSVNVDALSQLLKALRRPSLLVPQLRARRVEDLDFQKMHAAGIRYVVFDKDNTLTAPYVNEPPLKAKAAIAEAKRVFGERRCAVLSNSAGSADDTDGKQAKAAEESLGLHVIRHAKKKPNCLDDLLQALSQEKGKPDVHTVAIVGDRLLTDVFFANLFGMFAVHLRQPIALKGDNPPALIIRAIENFIFLPIVSSLAIAPPSHPLHDRMHHIMCQKHKAP